MKFTLDEWEMIYQLVAMSLDETRDKIREIKDEATPEGSSWPNDKKLEGNQRYAALIIKSEILTGIKNKLKTEEL